MSGLGITVPIGNADVQQSDVPDLTRSAEAAGFASAWAYELVRNPYISLSVAALATDRIRLGTCVATSLSRTPFTTAVAAADVDEISQGRTILGIGLGEPVLLATWHGVAFPSPLDRLREYVAAVRASWDYLATGKAGGYAGSFYQLSFLESPLATRRLARERVPLYIAAGVRPRGMQLAGEIADGLIGYLWTPGYVKDVVFPTWRRAPNDKSAIPHRLTWLTRSSAACQTIVVRRCTARESRWGCTWVPASSATRW